jgi:hypothetical protein
MMLITTMTHATGVSTKFSALALLCVGALLLAWAAPVLLLSGGIPEFSQRGQGRQTNDPADASNEIEDASDDPIVLVMIDHSILLPVTPLFQVQPVSETAWSPISLVRPPNPLNSI